MQLNHTADENLDPKHLIAKHGAAVFAVMSDQYSWHLHRGNRNKSEEIAKIYNIIHELRSKTRKHADYNTIYAAESFTVAKINNIKERY